MARRRGLYKLTEEDTRVFTAGVMNADAFTDFYFRTDVSGTIYPHTHERYDEIHASWHESGRPEKWEWEGEDWSAIWGARDEPDFCHHHGFRFIPWQLDIFFAAQKLRAIAGGFSAGKSLGMVAQALVLAATVERFKGMCVAPHFFQATLLYKMATQMMAETLYEERFLLNAVIAPFPTITVGNSHVGESVIEFKSASDDGESILSWRGDWAMIDQAENIPNIAKLRKNLGTRLVGKAPTGRPYLGIMNWVANAGPNPQFWELYKLGKENPEECISLTVTSYDNPHNSEDDLRRLEREVGGTQKDIDQWLLAKKPVTMGKHFSNATLNLCQDEGLENVMAAALAEKRPGFIVEGENDSLGVFRWAMPYEHGRSYLVVGDPGYSNRPDRNSPVIGVFDITDWPRLPAMLRSFHWLDGNGAISPFLIDFTYTVEKYKAHGQCAFDATGTQRSYDELALQFHNLDVEPVDFSKLKYLMLNALKILMERGRIRLPYIAGMWQQLGDYDIPDKKLQQDIVAMLMIAAYWLRDRMGPDEDEGEDRASAEDHDRGPRSVADRCPRAAGR